MVCLRRLRRPYSRLALVLLVVLLVVAGCQLLSTAESPRPGTDASRAPRAAEVIAPANEAVAAGPVADASSEVSAPTPAVADVAPADSGASSRPGATAEDAPPGAPAEAPADGPLGVVIEPRAPVASRVRTVVLDAGHGGPEIGAVSGSLAEKNVNVEIALMLAEMLADDGFRVVLTRDSDRAVHPEYVEAGVRGQVTRDLQARVDIANRANADVFIAIHNNGSGDAGQRGTEVWYNNQRPFADRNLALAELVQDGLLRHLSAIGHPTLNRGVTDDTNFRIFRGRAYNIYVLGPGDGPRPHVPTAMPGVLGESLFLSNPTDVAALRRPQTLAAIAGGYRDGIHAYFRQFPN